MSSQSTDDETSNPNGSQSYLSDGESDKSDKSDKSDYEYRNLCIECGVDMGDCNPRQLCGKTYCMYAGLFDDIDADSEDDNDPSD